MNVLLFNGEPEKMHDSTSQRIIKYFREKLNSMSGEIEVDEADVKGIPFFDFSTEAPANVKILLQKFQKADVLVWMTPLYHGSMTGAMKNALDWLELSSNDEVPYLTDKVVSFICWADGLHALNGINSMDSVAKSLRAWVMPFSIPVARKHLLINEEFSPEYKGRFDLMIKLITENKLVQKNINIKSETI